ncbi:hypothetical protein BD311DRAFT_7304 [Dichomitus squalens]|uniref:Uncharacterized protein n=1 Tax=Dichomitus squalens TaxID=114155 RepID=A0A4V2K276_9APHY|nr:hypothetical protein BD311DRAFT_7304 [Dichomitus squalens]
MAGSVWQTRRAVVFIPVRVSRALWSPMRNAFARSRLGTLPSNTAVGRVLSAQKCRQEPNSDQSHLALTSPSSSHRFGLKTAPSSGPWMSFFPHPQRNTHIGIPSPSPPRPRQSLFPVHRPITHTLACLHPLLPTLAPTAIPSPSLLLSNMAFLSPSLLSPSNSLYYRTCRNPCNRNSHHLSTTQQERSVSLSRAR